MLTAMWAELPGFSYLPLELMYYHRYGRYMFVSSAIGQFIKFICAAVLLLTLLLTVLHKSLVPLRVKLLYPLVFDALFVVFLYAIVDVLTCAVPMDRMPLGGGASTCACRDRVWLMAALASVVFAAIYIGALAYRIHLSEDVFGVRFRYPMSFSYLMTVVRTGTCLLYMTIIKLLESTDYVHTINITAMSIYFVLFAALFRYNYRLQPCLGSGLFPNNLRALSFATSCWSSLATIGTTFETTTVVVPLTFMALYPFGVVFLWRMNSARARQYHIQNQSLTDALNDANLRVRTVAIVSITLEDHSRWKTDEIANVLQCLEACLAMPGVTEDGLLVAYACQAVWHLCCTHCKLNEAMIERPGATDFAPFNLWVSHRPSVQQAVKTRQSNPGATTRLQELVDRKAETNTRSGISTVAPLLAEGSINTVSNEQLLKHCLGVVLQRATSMLSLPFPKACNVMAKLLQEMYIAQNVQLTLGTWLSVVCTLCGNYNHEVAAQAATSLCATMVLFDMTVVLPLLCDPAKLTAISQLLVVPNALLPMTLLRDKVVGVVLARAAAQVTRTAPMRDPIHMYTPAFVTNMSTAWRKWQAEYSMTLALESVLALMQKAQLTWRAMVKHKLKQKQMQSSGSRMVTVRSGNNKAPSSSSRREAVVATVVPEGGPTAAMSCAQTSRRSSIASVHSEIQRAMHASPRSAKSRSPSPSRHPKHNRPDRPSIMPAQNINNQPTKVVLLQNEPSRQRPGRRKSHDHQAPRKTSSTSNPSRGPYSSLTKPPPPPQHPLLFGLSKLLLASEKAHGHTRSFDHHHRRRHRRSNSVHAVVNKLRTTSLTGGDTFIRNLNHLAKGNGHDLVPPAIWREIKLRRAVRLRVMTQVTAVLAEGLQVKLLPQLFTPATVQALQALVALLHAYPVMRAHIAYVLHPDEHRYITFVTSWQQARVRGPVAAAATVGEESPLWARVLSWFSRLAELTPWASTDDVVVVPLQTKSMKRSTSMAMLLFPGFNFVTERRRWSRHPARNSLGRQSGPPV
ncbi:hypothetical protein DYB25_000764 [Aphanomyces astaci]|uniref:Uncharacterized protein n=1 Tax=Aphanomyces astaci TaxID=112090 RepID=A0A397ASQ4_APHAT|nr:hypothetical protein DYB36_002086 [Aphanomyces astaci]RHY11231.1 hypothetical protein DYB25_000764 [Aphanomyces astaci]RHY39177.1 hypothetical protein DYB30_001874 [Aphanomyces astaci]RHY52493.1 hypothetical protein DYB34_001297 [Aphanomyces astaci]RHY78318.1 hypothetical protein DYB38_002149 [Aphanomyces astaci]